MHPLRKLFLKFGLDVRRCRNVPDTPDYLSRYGSEIVHGRRFYNLGAGAFSHPCWTNIDLFPTAQAPAPHIHHDLMSLFPFPLPDGSAQLVYCSHTLEHVSHQAVAMALSEIYRILKPGGLFRVVVPDIALSYRAWKNNDRDFFYWLPAMDHESTWKRTNIKAPYSGASLAQIFLEDFASTASLLTVEGAEKRIDDDELNRVFKSMPLEQALDYCVSRCPAGLQTKFPYHHMNWFNEEKLLRMLGEAGFGYRYRSGYLQSAAAVLRNDKFFDTGFQRISLYAEAVR